MRVLEYLGMAFRRKPAETKPEPALLPPPRRQRPLLTKEAMGLQAELDAAKANLRALRLKTYAPVKDLLAAQDAVKDAREALDAHYLDQITEWRDAAANDA